MLIEILVILLGVIAITPFVIVAIYEIKQLKELNKELE